MVLEGKVFAKKVWKYISNPKKISLNIKIRMLNTGYGRRMCDAEYLKRVFAVKMGYALDLENPKTYNEKLQWLKLYDRRPEYGNMVDKYEAKKYVAERIGKQYIIPTLGVWDKFDDIDFDALPDQFVLKCTHDSGGLVICRDKSTFNQKAAKRKINACLNTNYYWRWREWPYKNVKPRIIAEQYMEDTKTAELRDYKFFAFDSVVRAVFIASDRQKKGEETKFDFFDSEFNHLPVINGHPNAPILPQKPERFEEMQALASKLSEGIPHLRVDFYEVNGNVYFGELTLYHWSGLTAFEPKEWDEIFGSWIQLPEKK